MVLVVTYSWYRFVDQPSFSAIQLERREKKANLAGVRGEGFTRAGRSTATTCLRPPAERSFRLDRGLFVTPPEGLEVGYVPIVTGQSAL